MGETLAPYDGSDSALAAVEYAVETFPDDDLTILHVVDRTYLDNPYAKLLVGPEELEARATERAEELLADAEAAAAAAGATVETAVRIGHPVPEILDYADRHAVERIVIGGTGLSNVPRLLMGSVALGVVLHADRPVTVVR